MCLWDAAFPTWVWTFFQTVAALWDDWPVLARDIRRYFSLVGVPSFAPAVAMANAEAAERALRLLSSSRQDDTTMPLLKENKENSAKWRREKSSKNKKIVNSTEINVSSVSLPLPFLSVQSHNLLSMMSQRALLPHTIKQQNTPIQVYVSLSQPIHRQFIPFQTRTKYNKDSSFPLDLNLNKGRVPRMEFWFLIIYFKISSLNRRDKWRQK